MSRVAVTVALAALLGGLVLSAVLTVSWTVLPGAHPVVAVSRDFTPAQVAREVAFHRALRPPAYGSLVLGLVVAALLGLTPLGGRLIAAAARPLGGGWVAQVVLGTLALTLVGRLVTLPLDARSEVVLRQAGLSTQGWVSWLADSGKAAALGWVVTALVLLGAVGLARLAPRTWWAWAAAGAAALVIAGSFAYPLVVEPLFNRFTPMSAGPLRTDLLQLAARDGVPVREVLVADASRRTTALNASVSGFGSTRRIVVYDTLLRDIPPAQVEVIVAHELGHAQRQDVLHGTVLAALAAAAGVCALALLLSWPALLRRAGADGPGDPRVLAAVLFLVAIGSLLSAPATNLVSRRIEARADVHSLDLTGNVAAFIASEKRLALTNLTDLRPNPVLYALFATHPTPPERIALARAWAHQHR